MIAEEKEHRGGAMFETSIAGSLPKPSWLAEPNKLWAAWRLNGAELDTAKADATLLAIKEQEDAGIDIVTDGEQSRQHFVHGFLEYVEGIDFAHKVEMGIRADRYKAMVPQVTDHRRHGRRPSLRRSREDGDGICGAAESGGARTRGRRRRRRAVR
jgi:methionine synthase II (cobalamin-independent)